MEKQRKLYANGFRLENYLIKQLMNQGFTDEDAKTELLEHKLLPLNNKDIIQDLVESQIAFGVNSLVSLPPTVPPLPSIMIRGILMTDTGIYLLDEINFIRKDRVIIPGCHLKEINEYNYWFEKYNSEYISAQLTQELWKSTTRAGYRGWEYSIFKSDIHLSMEQMGLPVVKVSDKWFFKYHPQYSFTIFIPILMGVDNRFVKFSLADYRTLDRLYEGNHTANHISKMLGLESRNDCRIRIFPTIKSIMNSYDDLRNSLRSPLHDSPEIQ